MKSAPIPTTLFIKNRAKLVDSLTLGSVVLTGSGDRMHRNGDQDYPFRQNSDFFYLTGINQEESVLVLAPGHPDTTRQEMLFISKPTPKSRLWSGPGLTLEEAANRSGITQVKWLEDLDGILELLIPNASNLYAAGTVLIERISKQYPNLSHLQLSPLMMQLRMVKEHEEVEEIKKGSVITRSAFLRVLKMMKPDIWEYEVEAEITAEFIGSGGDGHAYEPIIASGENALILHYVVNNNRCLDGDLLLMDFGAEVNNYAADCSRTIPVNGRFTKRQREVYEAVLRVFRQAKEMMVPGKVMSEFHNQVGKLWEEEHIRLKLYTRKDAEARSQEELLWKRYFMHGTSHSLGLDVHDPFDQTKPFQSGMVLTCEPAIYLPEEGIGIRLENDILITEGGPVDLMEEIPIEAGEIEELMQSNR